MASASATIPIGYKQTEVGVIPKDWSIINGSEMTVLISKGSSPKWQGFSYCDFGMLFVTSENVRDGYLDVSKPKYLPLEFHEKLHRTKLRKNDILINLVGASIGRSCRVTYDIDHGNVNQAVAVFRVGTNYSAEFVIQVFQSPKTIQRILDEQVDAARPNLSLTNLREFPIPLPTLAEQKVIATALSDSDSQIQALENLIAKKRDIKQGSMQELLTGKTRLPGFSEEWEHKRLEELAKIKTGSRNNQDKIDDGKYPFFVRSQTIENINTYSHECEAILVPGDGNIGSIFHYINGKFDVHQRVYAITNFASNVFGKYMLHFMSHFFGPYAMENTVKATVDSLRLPTFQNFIIRLPSLAEQKAIAEVLSDMDAEITALEQRLEKTKAIKQGMMQQLLTGRIRLVEPSTPVEASA